MEIEDNIYGVEEIKEDVLVELINSPSVQRLKGVSQLGMPEKYFYRKSYSRYEHSLGVLVLLRRLGANQNEQISGLLHDVSHTAFSHVIDWVLGDPTKEDYQDNNHLRIIKNSEIPSILKNYDFDYKEISNHENFPLLEKEAPSLCADRIDYSLRDLSQERGDLSKLFFKDLDVKENQIVFKTKNIAESFGEEYMKLQAEHWAGNQARTRYHILSEVLKKSLEKKLICLEDLNKTDYYVLNILENSRDESILESLNLLKKGFQTCEDENGILLKKKFRYIDPEVYVNSFYRKLSELSVEYAFLINEKKEQSKLVRRVKIIPN